jgi:uncharacterized protein YdcH (DUF465 family)|tara:strand:- start:58 stop:312 length:255 start_codon:yes stop_codon:yes gene_type:complete
MSNKNNVIPFPSKTDASLVEYRNTISSLIILEAQLHMMLEDIDALENEIHRLIGKKDKLVELLRQKNLIKITTEMANNNGDELH